MTTTSLFAAMNTADCWDTFIARERRKVMLAHERRSGFLHKCCIERRVYVPRAIAIERRTRGVVVDRVSICAACGMTPRVEVRIDFAGVSDGNLVR